LIGRSRQGRYVVRLQPKLTIYRIQEGTTIMDRRKGIVSMVALTSFLFCGMTAPQGCDNNNNGHGTAIAVTAVVAVGVTAAVIIAVHSSHHNLKGCAYSDKDGLHIKDGDTTKDYVLTGATPNIKVGDVVKVHGSKVKKNKGEAGDQTFVVEKLSKDYGACPAPVAATPAP
jgi:hypothetical protein